MDKFNSKLFGELEIPRDEDFGFYDTVPNLYIGLGTVENDEAMNRAIEFFDKAKEIEVECRKIFLANEDSLIEEYFEYFKDEAPEVFNCKNVDSLTLSEMINMLKFTTIASHENGDDQSFNVDFTLGYDQILCVVFDSNYQFDYISWES